MAACTSANENNYDEQETVKRASLCRCPNKQYTAPFWLKVKQLFIGKELKKSGSNKISEEQKRKRNTIKTAPPKIIDKRICSVIVLVTLFVCSSAACFAMWFTDIYLKQILETMTIHNGSFMFESWRKPSLKPLICVYAFNYTNLERFVAFQDKKLHIEETGPYCYRETLEKINVLFDDEHGTVTYGNKRSHQFEPRYSRGNPNDTLILPSLTLISAVSINQEAGFLKQMLLTLFINSSKAKVILKVTAHDFFFDYKDSILTRFASYMPYEKMGILAIRGADTDDTLTVKTGRDDLDHIDVVTGVNGQLELDTWHGDECNRIDGSDGAFFPRKDINSASTLYLFHQDICRKLPLVFDKYVDFQDGIMAMRFHMPPWVYDTNGTCYCNKNCPPKGAYDLSRCKNGIPIVMSFPHFLYGDPKLTEHIEGLKPNKSLHDFYIDIQPNLGFTLGMVSRLQVNIQVKKSKGVPYLHAFEDNMILPIVWLEVYADHLPPDLFRVIYHATFTVRHMQLCLMWGTLIASVVFALCTIHHLLRIFRKCRSKTPPLQPTSAHMLTLSRTQINSTNISGVTIASTSVCDTNV